MQQKILDLYQLRQPVLSPSLTSELQRISTAYLSEKSFMFNYALIVIASGIVFGYLMGALMTYWVSSKHYEPIIDGQREVLADQQRQIESMKHPSVKPHSKLQVL